MNPNELECYPFMISLNKQTGIFNFLSPKSCIPKETKNINAKAFNLIGKKEKAKTMTEHILIGIIVNVNTNSIVQDVIQIKNGIMKHANGM